MIAPGGRVEVPLPEVPRGGGAETWLTVTAHLADDLPWAVSGHEVAWGQAPLVDRGPVPERAPAYPLLDGGGLRLGPGLFDVRTGRLLTVGGLDVGEPRAGVWRVPTDNDEGLHGMGLAPFWRGLGLDRLTERRVAVDVADDALEVRTRLAPAARDLGLDVTYRWTADAETLWLDLTVTATGEWICPLPRLGIDLTVPGALGAVEWFGRGPARRTGTWPKGCGSVVSPTRSTDYRPPTCAHRRTAGGSAHGGWSCGTRPARGCGSRAIPSSSSPPDGGATTGWTRPGTRTSWSPGTGSTAGDTDHHGVGSASCGPGVLPAHGLVAGNHRLRAGFTRLRG